MSYETEFYKRIAEAKASIAKAYDELNIALNENTDGHSIVETSYIDEIQQVSIELLKLKRKL